MDVRGNRGYCRVPGESTECGKIFGKGRIDFWVGDLKCNFRISRVMLKITYALNASPQWFDSDNNLEVTFFQGKVRFSTGHTSYKTFA